MPAANGPGTTNRSGLIWLLVRFCLHHSGWSATMSLKERRLRNFSESNRAEAFRQLFPL